MSSEITDDGRRGVRMSVSELLAGIAILVAVMSGLNQWFVLPEQIKGIQVRYAEVVLHNQMQDGRMTSFEILANARSEQLARIDERTKRIEEAVKP